MVVVALAIGNLVLTVVILALFIKIRVRVGEAAANAIEPLAGQIDSAQTALEVKFGAATTDMAQRLERTKGDPRRGRPQAPRHQRSGFAKARPKHKGGL